MLHITMSNIQQTLPIKEGLLLLHHSQYQEQFLQREISRKENIP